MSHDRGLTGRFGARTLILFGLGMVAAADPGQRDSIEPSVATSQKDLLWRVIQVEPGQGEICLVCGIPILEGRAVAIQWRGRLVHVNEKMFSRWQDNPSLYFRKSQALSALFDEQAVAGPAVSGIWLGVGLHIVTALVVAGVCAYVAVGRGLPMGWWFFAGLVGHGVALIVLLTRRRGDGSLGPEGVPRGLVKVPTTHRPAVCTACGQVHHPSASRCPACGLNLQPSVVAETARV